MLISFSRDANPAEMLIYFLKKKISAAIQALTGT